MGGDAVNRQACPQCAAVQAENERLAQRVKQLEERLKAVRRMVKQLLDTALGIDQAAAEKQAGGNLPRSAWSYLKAVRVTVQALGRKLAELYAATLTG